MVIDFKRNCDVSKGVNILHISILMIISSVILIFYMQTQTKKHGEIKRTFTASC
jgi:prolipoprotein diacylglyceryltransferase